MCFSMEAKRCIFHILSLALICGTLSADPITVCPPSQLIEPCVCYKDCPKCDAEIRCEDITGPEVLSRVFTSEYQFSTFKLRQSSIMFIPDSFFEVRRLRYLYISDSDFVSLFDSTHRTTGNSSITLMKLIKLRILRGFQWEVLSVFNQLEDLEIEEMHVPRIDQSFIDHAPKSLKNLVIYRCSTKGIHEKAFASLPNLGSLSLSANIREVKRSMFSTPSELVSLQLSLNLLSSLPDDIFNEMPWLEEINLSDNLLKEMPGNIFGPVLPHLFRFWIDGNPLTCGCNISWITVVKNNLEPTDFLGMCQEPIKLKGRQIRDLVPEDFSHCD